MLAIGAVLYFTLADPDAARTYSPSVIPFECVHLILLGVLVFLTLAFVHNARGLTRR